MANWGLVGAAVFDAAYKGPEIIDIEMTSTMIGYSGLFMGFAWQVQPRNYLLFACHTFNVTAQANQLRRAVEYKVKTLPNPAEELNKIGTRLASAAAVAAGLVAAVGPTKRLVGGSALPTKLKDVVLHPAGPLTVFFWAPTSKWLFSVSNLKDLDKDTDKMSFAQMSALTATGIIWTRYSFVINPVNYNLAIVNLALGASSSYHLARKIKKDYM